MGLLQKTNVLLI